MRSGEAWVPPMTRARSPGISRSITKMTMLATTIATSSSPRRRSTYSVMRGSSVGPAVRTSTVIPEASNREPVSFVG